MSKDDKEIEIQVPPEEEMPDDHRAFISPADEPLHANVEGQGIREAQLGFFDRVQVESRLGRKILHLKMNMQQARRFAGLFEDFVHQKCKMLDEKYGDLWAIYTVKVQEWPPGFMGHDFHPETTDRDPIRERVVATSWTEGKAHDAVASVRHGDHPDFDPMDFDRGDYHVTIDAAPILGSEDDLPWEEDDDS